MTFLGLLVFETYALHLDGVIPRYSCIWVYPCEHFQEYSRRFKNVSQLRIEKVKSLPLDGYRPMLTTGPLGG